MQPGTGVGTQPDDVPGIGRNFRLVEHEIKHDLAYVFNEKGE